MHGLILGGSGRPLRLLGRPDCHLCEGMIAVLHPFLEAGLIMLTMVDVDSEPALAARYGLLIPVLLDGEHEISHYTLAPEALDAYLRKVGSC